VVLCKSVGGLRTATTTCQRERYPQMVFPC